MKCTEKCAHAVFRCTGPAACDRRRDIRLARKQFPGVDFSHIETNHDEVYEKHRMESEHAIQERGARFLQWIMSRRPPPPHTHTRVYSMV